MKSCDKQIIILLWLSMKTNLEYCTCTISMSLKPVSNIALLMCRKQFLILNYYHYIGSKITKTKFGISVDQNF